MDEMETTPGPDGTGGRPWWRRRSVIGGVLIVLAGTATAAVVLLPGDDDLYPDTWAPEVRPFADIVEDERGLEFEHPVHVEFLPSETFEKKVTADKSELSEEDEQELEQAAGMFRAVGLLEGDVDLFEAVNSVAGAGTLAYYSYKDKRIRIRGEKLTPASEVTLVHELTHALQDQHFDLGQRVKELEKADDDSASTAFDALIEGDASRIEAEYLERLDEDERAEIDEEKKQSSEKYTQEVSDLPAVVPTLFGAPYSLGEAMLDLVTLEDGNESVDELFARPPTTDEHLLDPFTLVGDREDAVEVEPPSLEEDIEEIDSGPFGALGWLLVLAERIPLLQALDATDGWGGDAYVSFEYAGKTCLQIQYEGDTAADVRQMDKALHRWIAVLPDSGARVERAGEGLLFTTCDPGTKADVGTDSSRKALDLALTRTYVAIGALGDGVNEDGARCLADAIVHRYSLEHIRDPANSADNNPKVMAQVRAMARACGLI